MTNPIINIEKVNIEKVNAHPSGPTERDEMAILASLFYYKDGVFFSERFDD